MTLKGTWTMGCDIHAFIDYDPPQKDEPTLVYYLGEFKIQRNYSLFGIMAGVRQPNLQLFQPRGMPQRMSWTIREKATLMVIDNDKEKSEGCCTRQQAERWGSNYSDENKRRVWNPDYHSHSWLNTAEVKNVFKKLKSDYGHSLGLTGALWAMEGLEKERCNPRLVFWFDN
jgi:hypothetical protein